jgi:hypothetical protein
MIDRPDGEAAIQEPCILFRMPNRVPLVSLVRHLERWIDAHANERHTSPITLPRRQIMRFVCLGNRLFWSCR